MTELWLDTEFLDQLLEELNPITIDRPLANLVAATPLSTQSDCEKEGDQGEWDNVVVAWDMKIPKARCIAVWIQKHIV